VFPHPDDEIAIIGWMSHLARRGVSVSALWMHSTPVREAESRAVMARAGVTDLTFLTATDGKLVDTWQDWEPAVRDWLGDRDISHPVTVAFEQGHLDHDATNWLVNRNTSHPVRELPLYHPYSRQLLRANVFAGNGQAESRLLSPAEYELKLSLLRSYPSQRIGQILQGYRLMSRLTGRPDPFRQELMRIQTHQDFRIPNHGAEFRQEIERSRPWARWISALKDVD
jgi:hypothetical protein